MRTPEEIQNAIVVLESVVAENTAAIAAATTQQTLAANVSLKRIHQQRLATLKWVLGENW